MSIFDPLHVGGIVEIVDRNLNLVDDRSAAAGIRTLKGVSGFDARTVILIHRDRGLETGLQHPFRERHRHLRRGKAKPRHIRIFGHDVRRCGVNDQQRLLCSGRHRAGGNRVRRKRNPGEQVDVILNDEFLREAARVIG